MASISIMESAPGPETVIDGVRYLYFGGTSYLGLANHPEVIEAGCEAMRRFGVHSATSRGGFGTNPPVRAVEERAAEFFGTDAAFYFSSGYMGNHIVAAAMRGEMEGVLVDEAAHYCVIEAARAAGLPVETFRSRDARDLGTKVRGRKRILVMADAVAPVTGTVAPINEYLAALEGTDSVLVLDDAHGIGVLGEQGRGLIEEAGFWSHVNGGEPFRGVRICVCGTLAKALGGFGGIIPGTAEFVKRLRAASHFYEGASAPASAVAGASAKALEIVRCQPELRTRLRENVARLRSGLRALGLEVPEARTAQTGVSIGSADRMRAIHERLKEREILVPYFQCYSGVPSEGILRIAVFATHTPAQVERLLDELRAALG